MQDCSSSSAELLFGDGNMILFDRDGTLGLETFSAKGIKLFSRVSVLENLSPRNALTHDSPDSRPEDERLGPQV